MSRTAEFLLTIADPSQLQKDLKGDFLKGHREPRWIMVGRSNVGKSSLINRLIGIRLARTSATPGKTRAIHFYSWPEAKVIIADLPGYGFAQVPKAERDRWRQLIEEYIQADRNLVGAIVLVDARHGPLESDLEAIDFLSFKGLPVTLVFTKVDAIKSQSQRNLRAKEVAEVLKAQQTAEKAQKADADLYRAVFWVSSRTGDGIKPLIKFLVAGAQRRS